MVNPVTPALSTYSVSFSAFQAMHPRKFTEKFPQDHVEFIPSGEMAYSEDKPIVSYEIGDCITVFGVQKDGQGHIESIAGYHAELGTGIDSMKEYLESCFDKDALTWEIFLIGGTAESIKKGSLLSIIHEGLKGVLKDKYKIIEEKVNLPGDQYVTAALTMKGELFFCRHEFNGL